MALDQATAQALQQPDTIGVDAVSKVIASVANDDPALPINRKFYEGDHWQGGDGWVGPRPIAGEAGADTAMAEIQRVFVSKNVIAEVVDRHTQGVIGDEPGWTVVPRREIPEDEEPTEAEATAIAEANTLLTQWWDAKHPHEKLRAVVSQVLFTKRSMLRLYVPASQATSPGTGSTGGAGPAEGSAPGNTVTLAPTSAYDAIMLIFPDTPLAEQAVVYEDPQSRRQIAMLLQQVGNRKTAEIVYLDSTLQALGGRVEAGENPDITRPSAVANTKIRTVTEGGGGGAEVVLPLGGRLTMMEISRPAMITEQIRSAQKALNLAASMVPRNVVTGGFLDRILTNAQLPGHFEKDATTGLQHWVLDTPKWGAGSTAFIQGTMTEDETTGKQTVAPVGVYTRDPVPVTSSVEGKATHYQDILDAVDQRHVLMGSDATASGYSREQARKDFGDSLTKTETHLVALGRWMLETVLAFAEALLETPGRWTDLVRIEFRPFVNLGPLSAEEQTADDASVAAGTMSLETALQRRGEADIDAELQRIRNSQAALVSYMESAATVLNTLFNAGLPLEEAGRLLNMTTEQIAILKKAVETEPAAPPAGGGGGAPGNGTRPGAGRERPAAR